MPTEELMRKILEANRRFHEELVTRGAYADQPFLNDLNRARVGRILERLSAEAGDDALLDVGCGTGFILGIAEGIFRRLAGVDLSAKMMERVHIPGVELRVAQAESLPFPDGSFNVITLHGVLHHLYRLEEPFREIHRCLTRGGVFYADESPNAYCLRNLHDVDTSDPGISRFLKEAAASVQNDVAVYESRYGLDPDVIRMAMYRDKVLGGLDEEEVREALGNAGFSDVEYQYRWFLGQGKVFSSGYGEESLRMDEYLRSLLPLTRSLFKYISFTARKG